MDVNVQFADATNSVVITYFASPQDAGAYENLGTVATSDPQWASFYNSFAPNSQRNLPSPG
ncbi:hypothetical protein ABIC75_003841 [Dyella japonica]|uniref:Uncharacterized protein n=1 Tax=Dyella japonica TaxID=231455 RepID=A0ABV2JZ42_9GAMM